MHLSSAPAIHDPQTPRASKTCRAPASLEKSEITTRTKKTSQSEKPAPMEASLSTRVGESASDARLARQIIKSQRLDLSIADKICRQLLTLLKDPSIEAKNLKEISGVINQISGTRKNVFSYGKDQKEPVNNENWTTKLEIEGLADDAIK